MTIHGKTSKKKNNILHSICMRIKKMSKDFPTNIREERSVFMWRKVMKWI